MENKTAPSYPIGSVDNALKLLVMFRTQRELRLTEAAQRLGVARSTAHRLMAMLEFHDFVAQDPNTRAYLAGPTLVEVGLAVISGTDTDIVAYARPVMTELSRKSEETVNLGLLRGRDMLFVDCIEGPKPVRVGARTGVLLPAHCTSAGKALLAQMSHEEFRRLYRTEKLDRATEASITTRTQLERELEKVRRAGYATNFGESEPEIHAVGAAILDHSGRPRAALALAAPRPRLGNAEVKGIAALVMRAAVDVARQLP
jgi:DNA-binding IclR family transcriptional regulator